MRPFENLRGSRIVKYPSSLKPILRIDRPNAGTEQEAISMTHGLRMPETTAFISIDGIKVRTVSTTDAQGIPVLLTAPWPESIFAFNLV